MLCIYTNWFHILRIISITTGVQRSMSDVEITYNSFSCPTCNTPMIMVFYCGKYQSHGCPKCKIFFELENIKEFQ